jgi:hypothetical protein
MSASTRGDVKIIEASEDIRLLGQKIAKDYLFYYKNSKKIELKRGIYLDIKTLDNSLIEIATITTSRDSKNILDFLAYNKDEIKLLLDQDVNKESSILMLDYGETFLEGANSIAKEHKYEFSQEEEMLMSLKKMEYLIERISKYYVASSLNLDKKSNFENMKQAIADVESLLNSINRYSYPDNLSIDVEKMNHIWNIHKNFLIKSDELLIPNLMLSSENILEEVVHKIALYHRKNK